MYTKRIHGKDRLCAQGGHMEWIWGVFKMNTEYGKTVFKLNTWYG